MLIKLAELAHGSMIYFSQDTFFFAHDRCWVATNANDGWLRRRRSRQRCVAVTGRHITGSSCAVEGLAVASRDLSGRLHDPLARERRTVSCRYGEPDRARYQLGGALLDCLVALPGHLHTSLTRASRSADNASGGALLAIDAWGIETAGRRDHNG
jgi:hypothetical protein